MLSITNFISVLGGVLCISSAALAQNDTTSNTLLSTPGGMTINEVAAIFQAESMEAEVINKKEITAEAWGFEFEVLGYHCNEAVRCTEFLFITGFDLPNGFPLKKINEWNFNEPAGRAFIDEENDPFLDHSVSVSGPNDVGAFREGLLLWLNALQDYEKFLTENIASA